MATNLMVSVITLASVLSIVIVNAAPNVNVITVGDGNGWTLGFDYQLWAQDKQFHVGDILVFSYAQGSQRDNGNRHGIQNCVKTPNSGILASGEDKIVLKAAGNMWFICGVGEHCESGQKLKITVTETSPLFAAAPSPLFSSEFPSLGAFNPARAP